MKTAQQVAQLFVEASNDASEAISQFVVAAQGVDRRKPRKDWYVIEIFGRLGLNQFTLHRAGKRLPDGAIIRATDEDGGPLTYADGLRIISELEFSEQGT